MYCIQHNKYTVHMSDMTKIPYILKDFENASPRLNHCNV